jgi:hypothetical protein
MNRTNVYIKVADLYIRVSTDEKAERGILSTFAGRVASKVL